jgi:hypothetical protein
MKQSFMNPMKHIKRLFKSLNKRIAQPIYRYLKPLIRWIINDPYEIELVAHNSYLDSDFAVVNNVLDYEHVNFNTWKISALEAGYQLGLEKLPSKDEQIYIVLDTKYHDAFGHWFFESAIWVPKIKWVLDTYPNAKLYLREIKTFKLQILEYFGIMQNKICTEFSEYKNVCIFPNPCTAFNDIDDFARFKVMVKDFSKEFHNEKFIKDISYLLMPRQKKENFSYNDRELETDDLKDYIEKINSSEIFNTDNSPSFAAQIKALQSSKHIIVADGSAFSVNGFLAKNSVIFVLGDSLVPAQRQYQKKMQALCEYIEHNNAVMYVNGSNNVFTKDFIESWVQSNNLKIS